MHQAPGIKHQVSILFFQEVAVGVPVEGYGDTADSQTRNFFLSLKRRSHAGASCNPRYMVRTLQNTSHALVVTCCGPVEGHRDQDGGTQCDLDEYYVCDVAGGMNLVPNTSICDVLLTKFAEPDASSSGKASSPIETEDSLFRIKLSCGSGESELPLKNVTPSPAPVRSAE